MATTFMSTNTNFDEILEELCMRIEDGKPNFSNKEHLKKLTEILEENNWPKNAIKVFIRNLWLIAGEK